MGRSMQLRFLLFNFNNKVVAVVVLNVVVGLLYVFFISSVISVNDTKLEPSARCGRLAAACTRFCAIALQPICT